MEFSLGSTGQSVGFGGGSEQGGRLIELIRITKQKKIYLPFTAVEAKISCELGPSPTPLYDLIIMLEEN